MKIDFALFCSSAEVTPDGLIYVLRGGFDLINATHFPARGITTVVLRLSFKPDESGRDYSFTSHVVGTDGVPLDVSVTIPVLPIQRNKRDANRPSKMTLQLVYNNLTFPKADTYLFKFFLDEIHIGEAELEVRQQP